MCLYRLCCGVYCHKSIQYTVLVPMVYVRGGENTMVADSSSCGRSVHNQCIERFEITFSFLNN